MPSSIRFAMSTMCLLWSANALAAGETGPAPSPDITVNAQVTSSITLTITGRADTSHSAAGTSLTLGDTYYGQANGSLSTNDGGYTYYNSGLGRQYAVGQLNVAVVTTGSFGKADVRSSVSSVPSGSPGTITMWMEAAGFNYGTTAPSNVLNTTPALLPVGGGEIVSGSSVDVDFALGYTQTVPAATYNTTLTFAATGKP